MSDRAARQRRRPPAAAAATPPGSDGLSTAGRRTKRQGGRQTTNTGSTTTMMKPTTTATASREMASLTTSLLDKNNNENRQEVLELLQSSSNQQLLQDEEKNSGHHNTHLSSNIQQLSSSAASSSSSSSSSAALMSFLSCNKWRRRMRHFLTKLGSAQPALSASFSTSTLATPSSCSCRGCLPRRHHRHHPHILAFLSHICFILASSLYIQLSFVNRNWIFVARDQYHVPKNVLVADDDAAWHNWETSSYSSSSYITFQSDNNNNSINNNNYTTMTRMMMMMDDDIGYDPILEDIRSKYTVQSTSLQIYASLFFVLVGIFDLLRYRDTIMNVFMICAGGAGMASGMAQSCFMESVWNCVSVHIYLLEAYNLSHRERTTVMDYSTTAAAAAATTTDDDGDDIVVVNDHRRRDDHRGEEKHLFVKVGNTCFLVGCILDVLGSYVDLAGAQGLWVIYADMTSNFLWLECALIELGAEIYFLRRATNTRTRSRRKGNANDEQYTAIS